ncbi:hypothetical protein GCM10010195_05520 [Kitasatospora griseola]|nr:hypothetical protein GCM10010195_05520 [Kitasatospora griseola]
MAASIRVVYLGYDDPKPGSHRSFPHAAAVAQKFTGTGELTIRRERPRPAAPVVWCGRTGPWTPVGRWAYCRQTRWSKAPAFAP